MKEHFFFAEYSLNHTEDGLEVTFHMYIYEKKQKKCSSAQMFVHRFTPNQYRFSPFPLTQTKITKKRYHRLLTESLFMIH